VRETELWTRLRALLGETYAPVWADSVVHADLGGRTVTTFDYAQKADAESLAAQLKAKGKGEHFIRSVKEPMG